MILLMTAGEGIFILPFLLARIFRPTFLAVFQLNNLQLGTLYTTYGIIALTSYLMGGTLADKYPPQNINVRSLAHDSIGRYFLGNFP